MLYDFVFNNAPETIKDLLSDAVVVRVDNIAEYFKSSEQSKTAWEHTDFPHLVPPFNSLWIEYTYHYPTKSNQSHKIGIHVVTLGRNTVEGVPGFEMVRPLKSETKWLIIFEIYMEVPNKLGDTGILHFLQVDEMGNIFPEKFAYLPPAYMNAREWTDGALSTNFISFCGPAMLAISFMNCKNVELVEHKPGTTHRERRNRPRITYHTLEIEPMKKILRTEGRSEETGLKMALHICRGHFKDFSKGKGLFGKYKGLYWWDNQVRGDAQHGEARKDYNVNAPQNE